MSPPTDMDATQENPIDHNVTGQYHENRLPRRRRHGVVLMAPVIDVLQTEHDSYTETGEDLGFSDSVASSFHQTKEDDRKCSDTCLGLSGPDFIRGTQPEHGEETNYLPLPIQTDQSPFYSVDSNSIDLNGVANDESDSSVFVLPNPKPHINCEDARKIRRGVTFDPDYGPEVSVNGSLPNPVHDVLSRDHQSAPVFSSRRRCHFASETKEMNQTPSHHATKTRNWNRRQSIFQADEAALEALRRFQEKREAKATFKSRVIRIIVLYAGVFALVGRRSERLSHCVSCSLL